MKKPVATRRQKAHLKSETITTAVNKVNKGLSVNSAELMKDVEPESPLVMTNLTMNDQDFKNQVDDLSFLVESLNGSLTLLSSNLQQSTQILKKIEMLENELKQLKENYTVVLENSNQQVVSIIQQELKNYQAHI